jgi:hypothetical protein
MRPTSVFFLLHFVLTVPIYAQNNLVPNPSFEILDSCPGNFGLINRALGWYGINISPDYFNRCAPNNRLSVPANYFGYQMPLIEHDEAYCGLFTQPYSDSVHEVIGINLMEPLQKGIKYYVSFLASPSYIVTNPSGSNIVCFCDKIGAKFFSQPIPESNHCSQIIDDFAQVYSDVLMNDTAQWYQFNESFISDSAYTFMCIGFFYTLGNMSCECLNTMGFSGYTYIDNVCVSTDSLVCISSTGNEPKHENDFEIKIEEEVQQIAIFLKNPSNHISCEIFNVLGQIVYLKEINSSENYINYGNWTPGIYLIRIQDKVFKFKLF